MTTAAQVQTGALSQTSIYLPTLAEITGEPLGHPVEGSSLLTLRLREALW